MSVVGDKAERSEDDGGGETGLHSGVLGGRIVRSLKYEVAGGRLESTHYGLPKGLDACRKRSRRHIVNTHSLGSTQNIIVRLVLYHLVGECIYTNAGEL